MRNVLLTKLDIRTVIQNYKFWEYLLKKIRLNKTLEELSICYSNPKWTVELLIALRNQFNLKSLHLKIDWMKYVEEIKAKNVKQFLFIVHIA